MGTLHYSSSGIFMMKENQTWQWESKPQYLVLEWHHWVHNFTEYWGCYNDLEMLYWFGKRGPISCFQESARTEVNGLSSTAEAMWTFENLCTKLLALCQNLLRNEVNGLSSTAEAMWTFENLYTKLLALCQNLFEEWASQDHGCDNTYL